MRNRLRLLAYGIAFVAFTAGPASATTLGVRAGVSIAKASLDIQQNLNSDNRTGFAGTVFLDGGGGLLGLQPEVSYLQKGVKDGTTGEVVELDYVELAALVKAGLPLGLIQPHVFVGIGADYSTNSTTKLQNIDFSVRNADWSLPIGADVRIPLGKYALYGDARYAIGLTDINKGSANVQNLKNRAWILSAGIGCSF